MVLNLETTLSASRSFSSTESSSGLGSTQCGTCNRIAQGSVYVINGLEVIPAPGNCCSYNLVYTFICKLCNKNCIARTTRFLRQRVNEHRTMFYKLLSDPQADLFNPNDPDGYCLGRHLIDGHCCVDGNDFNSSYQIFILLNSSPRT